MNSYAPSNVVSTLKIAAVFILLVVAISLLPGRIPYETVREGGPIEILSAAGYFLFCIFIIHFNMIGAIRTSMAPGFFVLLLGLRELDFHARFTTMGMFKIRFFTSPEVPAGEKIIVTVFVLFLLGYGMLYLRRALRPFMKKLLAGRPYAFSIACAGGCILLSKALDGNTELLGTLLPMVDDPRNLARTVEECMELFIPVFLLRALLQYSWDVVGEGCEAEAV